MSLEQFRKDLEDDYFASYDQRELAESDLRFCDVDGAMYDGWFEKQFKDRPTFEHNLISSKVYDYISEFQESRPGIKYLPDDFAATDKDASLITSLFRRDYLRGIDGIESVDNCVSEQAKCGVGAVWLAPEYVDDEDPNDERQRIHFHPIVNAHKTVLWDRGATRRDKSDARRVTYLDAMTAEDAEVRYGEDVSSAFDPPSQQRFPWRKERFVHIAYRYEIRTEKVASIQFRNPLGRAKTVFASDMADFIDEMEAMGYQEVRRKDINRRRVYRTVFCAGKILEEARPIAGKYLPIVPLYGYRGYVDGNEFFYGIIRKFKDANRAYCMAVNGFVETAAASSKRMPIFTTDQVEGREEDLSQMHSGAYNYIEINPVDVNGQAQHIGPVGYWEPSTVDPNAAAMMTAAQDFIANGTGSTPKEIEQATLSGVAVDRLSEIVNRKTSYLRENIKAFYLRLGEVYRSMAGEIYDSERVEHLINEDGSDERWRLFDVVIDQETGKPKYINDITNKNFAVTVQAGASYATQRRETVAQLQEVGKLLQEAGMTRHLQLVVSNMIENIDGVNIDDLQEFTRKDKIISGLTEPKTDEEKQWLAQAMQQQDDSQSRLLKALEQKELAEAQGAVARAQKDATQARVNEAKVAQIFSEIDVSRFRAVNDSVTQATQQLQRHI